ncbi:ABC transporter ATP-binding protein [Sporohalobacter salinus]|uniref:ABC transporter ATP-binding protein n=1 Tax=Sporohalobacter salinus TaxID=1494606 RepID=UPI00195F6F27|nr:ABC transporter ATP-binding protein [Sporohalobacter salinus]MBM7624733.1 putative ABC transport system ATP-binding protein [Sporohalobacter salinus]
MSLIQLENVSKIYDGDVHALDNVSLEIEAGEWLSIMGPSGSGKSTMLNLIGCMDTPSKGQVKIDGIDISKLDKKELTTVRREKIGLVFQQFHLVPYLTAVENVMTAQYYHSMADEEEAREALTKVGLEHRADHLPKELSGGEQQRVCVARALINYPKLILADEPTGNLDKENENIVLDLFTELHKQGHSILMVTHDPKVGELAQRQINLDHGRLM